MDLNLTTRGKWILAGEHTVIRGGAALVFPMPKFEMNLTWSKTSAPMNVTFGGERGQELNLIFWGLIENALKKTGRHRGELVGELSLFSDMPLGAGLGASAALCVAVTRLFAHFGWVKNGELFEFARGLENLFHGESSGVDIAVALEDRGIKFQRGERMPLRVNWKPNLYLSYSGKRGVTSECVRRVRELIARDAKMGEALDERMKLAVKACEEALAKGETEGLSQLGQAMDEACDVFYEWGLCEGPLDRHIQELRRLGADAVKPTGSGGGGYALSLWKSEPSNIPFDAIPLF